MHWEKLRVLFGLRCVAVGPVPRSCFTFCASRAPPNSLDRAGHNYLLTSVTARVALCC
jgi:hypothetical protein